MSPREFVETMGVAALVCSILFVLAVAFPEALAVLIHGLRYVSKPL